MAQLPTEPVSIIPKPVTLERRDGAFTVSASTSLVIGANDAGARAAATHLINTLARGTGTRLTIDADGPERAHPGAVTFWSRNTSAALGGEGYELDVARNQVAIHAASVAGFFNAVQTLLQLLPPEVLGARKSDRPIELTIPCVRLVDRPRFQWRGVMLDVCRHLFAKDEILRFIDTLALHKLNVFHWHLTEDHGWRIEIKKHPKLTQIGAWRDGIGFGLDPKFSRTYDKQGRYGGYYTQGDVREIVAYAAARNVTVVPEIEMPGHAQAALAAYPELSCTGGPFEVSSRAGVHDDVFCAGNDAVFTLLEDVLDEVLPLFPSTFVHVGGDECPKTRWQQCPKCQARIRTERLEDEHELQSWFIKRMETFLNARGRRLIGWDEILEGGLAPNATVMSWRGVAGGVAAAKAGHDVVMSPTTHCYLDYPQSEHGEPRAIGSLLSLDKVYSYEPIPAELTRDESRHVLGVQANLWTEYVPDIAHAEYMTWPRAAALAEVAWSTADAKDYRDFERRLGVHLRRLDAMGVAHRPPVDVTFAIDACDEEPGCFQITPPPALRGLDIRCTLDGAEPTRDSTRHQGPFTIDPETRLIRAGFFDPRGAGRAYAQAFIIDGRACQISAFIHHWQRHVLRHIELAGGRLLVHSHEPMSADDHVTLTLHRPQPLRHVSVTTGDGAGVSAGAQLRHGVLEVSSNGRDFSKVSEFTNGVARGDVSAAAVSAVRIRATRSHDEPITISTIRLN